MSLLDDALDRQLKKLFPERFAPVPAPVKKKSAPMNHVNRQIHLEYQEGTSDKVYNVILMAVGTDAQGLSVFAVNFEYGRRGYTLQKGTKTNTPLNFADALFVYNKLVNDKMAKGYVEN
jgi:predicted DNA-binding WGR domain protein